MEDTTSFTTEHSTSFTTEDTTKGTTLKYNILLNKISNKGVKLTLLSSNLTLFLSKAYSFTVIVFFSVKNLSSSLQKLVGPDCLPNTPLPEWSKNYTLLWDSIYHALFLRQQTDSEASSVRH